MGDSERGTVYLLDTSYFIFRAYHALPPLNTSSGLPTNAVHGVATMLEKLIREKRPRWIGACFDTARATFRRELYPPYKANRTEPEEDLRVQFPYVRRLVAALEIPVLDREGFEADDILATLAARYETEGFDVVLVTGDKDLMQCVTDRVSLYDPVKDLMIGREEVIEKFGVPPAEVAEVLGLMGDTSDNIPGVKGIGPKTASALVAHFHSVDELLERSAEIEGLAVRGAASVRKKIEDGADMARLCRDLARVRRDVPVSVEPKDLELGHLATDELEALARELEMGRLVARMRAAAEDAGAVEALPRDVTGAGTTAGPAPEEFADSLSGGEWTDLGELATGRLFVVGEKDEAGAWQVALSDGERRSRIRDGQTVAAAVAALVASGCHLVGHDLKALRRELAVEPGAAGLDLGVASYLCDPEAGDHSPADVARRFLAETLAQPLLAPARLDQIARAAGVLEAQLEGRDLAALYRELEHPLVSVLARIEAEGILLDLDTMASLSKDLETRMKVLVERVYEAAGGPFNILSPVQLREVLYQRLGLPTKGIKNTKTGLSTDGDALEILSPLHPLPALVLEYRGLAKLKSTYVDSLPKLVDPAGRVHTRLHQTVAATGRLSSSDPNLQNIPVRTEEGARIRSAFVARPGWKLVSADYNQIELRVLAHLADDETLIAAFRSGRDIHTATASEVLGVPIDEVTPAMRRSAKVVNYGIVYGMGATRLARELGIARSEADGYIKRYFEKYSKVQRFYQSMIETAREKGFVSTLFGRRRYLPDILSDHGGRRQQAERLATNTPIQGSAADIIKRAMVRLDEELGAAGHEAKLILQIHDELLVESPAAEVDAVSALLVRTMEGAAELRVPIVVDVGSGTNWAEAH